MFRVLTEGSSNGGLQVETDPTVVKNGLYLDSDGEIRYYIDGTATYMGLIYVNGYYYYIRSSGVAVRNANYWPTATNGLMESATYHFDEFGRMTNPPDGSYVATSSGTGMQIDYTYDANGMRKTKTVTTGTLASVPRDGLHWDEDGVLRYYEDGYLKRVGLIWEDGHYYYIKSDGTAVCDQVYWISHNNGLLPNQDYTFNEYGWLIDPVTEEDFEVAMSARGKVTEERFFDWVVDPENSTSVTYTYIYNGGSLTQMTGDDQTLTFAYDGSGKPMAVTWNGTTYLYLTNIQGDVIAILDTDGNIVVQYTYDAWGNILTTGTLANTLGTLNPLTYRAYVYDQETGLYYLQSRYYNPEIGRFINADALVATGQGLLGNNMFAYCNNNPINYVDADGETADVLTWWSTWMSWLVVVDGALPIGDFIYGVGLVLLIADAFYDDQGDLPQISYSEESVSISPPPPNDNDDDDDYYDDDYYNNDDNFGGYQKTGKVKGNAPGNNQAQNKQVDNLTKGLNKNQKEIVHREITGEGLGYHEIAEVIKDLFGFIACCFGFDE